MNEVHTNASDTEGAVVEEYATARGVYLGLSSTKDSVKAELFVAEKKPASLLSQVFGRAVSFVSLVMLSPLFLVLFVIVRLQTPRVFKWVERISSNSRKFVVLNFCCSVFVDGKLTTTRIGNVLQKTGADQLPMLISVLTGKILLREAIQIARLSRTAVLEKSVPYDKIAFVRSERAIEDDVIVIGGSRMFWATKRVFDVVMSIALLPVLAIVALALLVLNPFWNKGTLFFVQKRMGKDCVPFAAIKFRTMTGIVAIERGPNDPVESNRIKSLGGILRKVRLDELPQILNVFKGEMSLIGPRPDFYDHAISFVESVSNYRARHSVRPGISGLAQVHLGYAVGIDATRSKTHVDHIYIANAGFAQEVSVFFKTIVTVLCRGGS